MNFREEIKDFTTIVIKLGSNVVTEKDNRLDKEKLTILCREIAGLHQLGKKIILISSGSISAGKKILNSESKQIEVLQAQSSIGQPILMKTYSQLFTQSGLDCAQLLLTHDDFKNRKRFLNVRNTLTTLLDNNVIPILNENDAVSFTEITVGDNDHLAAMTAQMMAADVLLLITSANGVYNDDPANESSKIISTIQYDDDISYIKTKTKTDQGRGGMASKIKAVQKVTPIGITGLICPANVEAPITSALTKDVGTIFLANQKLQPHRRKAWLISTQKQNCCIELDQGAYQALVNKKSLLPKGIVTISGQFLRGDCIAIKYKDLEFALGLVEYSDKDLTKIIGKNSSEIEAILGYKISDEVIHKNNLLIKDDQ